ncbi:MAG: HNH endonuclease [Sedimentisphaerales bacterium]|nr:HNH endonuclease [Sedimentisphaerales bacterium]
MRTKSGLPRKCENCCYACPLKDGSRTLLICANTPEAPGQIVRIRPEDACPNFCTRRRPVFDGARKTVLPKPPNDEIRYIPLTQGQFAIVDAADYESLARYNWFALGNERTGFYAARWLPGHKTLLMHRAIMNPPPGMVVDHIDGNRSNNRRANLRVCTPEQNARNRRLRRDGSSRFKGVSFHRLSRKWIASICYDGKQIYLGSFDDETEAARAYDRKARDLFGEFARLNFPEDYE